MRQKLQIPVVLLGLALTATPALAKQPVIDMHAHAGNAVQASPSHPDNIAVRTAYQAEADENNVVLFAASGAQAFVESWGEFFGD